MSISNVQSAQVPLADSHGLETVDQPAAPTPSTNPQGTAGLPSDVTLELKTRTTKKGPRISWKLVQVSEKGKNKTLGRGHGTLREGEALVITGTRLPSVDGKAPVLIIEQRADSQEGKL